MPTYDVHVYVEAEVCVTDVEAESFEQAAASAGAIDLAAAVRKTAPLPNVAYVEYAGTVLDYLVDERDGAGGIGESLRVNENLEII